MRWQHFTGAALCVGALLGAAAPEDAPKPPADTTQAPPSQSEPNRVLQLLDPFVGTFADERTTLVLMPGAAPDTLKGKIVSGGITFPLTAKRDGTRLTGSFSFEESRYDFIASIEGHLVILKTGKTTYRLPRVKPQNPITAPGLPDADPTVADGRMKSASSLPPMVVHGHRSGTAMLAPKTWAQRAVAERRGNVLVPDGPNPRQKFILMRLDANGANNIDDPRHAAFFDEYMRSSYPGTKRVGGLEKFQTLAGPGVIARFAGKLPSGNEVSVAMYAVMDGGFRFCMVNVVAARVADQNRRAARVMFATIGWGLGATDDRLVGQWYDPNGPKTQAAFGIPPQPVEVYRFGQDRTCALVRRASPGPATDAPSVRPALAETFTDEGMWFTKNDRLAIAWGERGAQTVTFRLPEQPGGDLDVLNLIKPDGTTLRLVRKR